MTQRGTCSEATSICARSSCRSTAASASPRCWSRRAITSGRASCWRAGHQPPGAAGGEGRSRCGRTAAGGGSAASWQSAGGNRAGARQRRFRGRRRRQCARAIRTTAHAVRQLRGPGPEPPGYGFGQGRARCRRGPPGGESEGAERSNWPVRAKEDVAQGEAQLRADQAQLALLQQQLKDADLLAPLDAVVRSRIVEPGEIASPQKAAFTLAITDPKWVRAYVGEPTWARCAKACKATVTVDAFQGRSFPGWVGFISPVAEFTPKSVETTELRSSLVYEIRVFVHDPGDELRLGMPAPCTCPLSCGVERRGRVVKRAPIADPPWSHRSCASVPRKEGPPVQALDGVSLEARHGELTALVGPDGAGKTTLMRLAAGLLRADSGSLKVLGVDVASDPQQVQDRISYMPQRFGLVRGSDGRGKLDLYADLHGVSTAERAQRYPQLMEMTALGAVQDASRRPTVRRHETEARAWPARWCARRSCCCWMSPRSGSIRCRGANCGTSCAAWSPIAGPDRAAQHSLSG
jgi:hypothetical protein